MSRYSNIRLMAMTTLAIMADYQENLYTSGSRIRYKVESKQKPNVKKSVKRNLSIFRINGVNIQAYSRKDAIVRYRHRNK